MASRGFIQQCTDESGLDNIAQKSMITGYIGYDCTAPSLHIGNLISIMMLRQLQQTGHRPLIVIGGGTTKIGDPSGKDETRQILTHETIAQNKQKMHHIFEKFLSFGDQPTDAIIIDNDTWLSQINYIDFLRDYGQHFSVNRMLSFDSVKLRLDREQTLSFLEFNYMILQAYDFLELNRRYDCRLQMGGSDQWGNIINGIELARRTNQTQLYGLTTPLLTTRSGVKMGKTAKGAIWLNADMLSPWDYWQFWRNTADQDIGRFLKLFTELPLDEISKLEQLQDSDINHAKKILATEVTALLHGRTEADKALKTAETTFETIHMSPHLPTIHIPNHQISDGISLIEILKISKSSVSNGEARRLIQGGGVRINDVTIMDIKHHLYAKDAIYENDSIKLSIGKKRHMLMKIDS